MSTEKKGKFIISEYLDKLDACLPPTTKTCDRHFFRMNAIDIMGSFMNEVAKKTAANDKKLDIEETEPIYRELPTKQILFVEDGSVDLDELKTVLQRTSIEVIVYRQGSPMPKLVSLREEMIKKL